MSELKTTELECEKCGGVCCKYYLSSFPRDNFVAEEHYKQRAERIIKFNDKINIAILYQPCPLFSKETGLCTNYENRNSTCRDYPVEYIPEWASICALMRKKFTKERTGKFQVLKI